MKPIYTKTAPKTGVQVAGIVSIDVVPREWLASEPQINFTNGCVDTPVSLLPGKTWISLQFTQESYSFEQKPKATKAGSFYETSFAGTTNDLDPVSRQLFETLRYHQLVARIRDRQKRLRLVGTKTSGLQLQLQDKEGNNNAGTKIVSVDMMMDSEALAPFYLVGVPTGGGNNGGGSGGPMVGISPLFLAALTENRMSGGLAAMLNFYNNRTTSGIVEVYNLLVQQATDSIINVAIANDAGLQKSEYIIDPDLSSLQAFVSYLNAWLRVNGTGQSLVISGNELRLLDSTASNAYMGIAIPKNLLAADNDTLLLAW